jgi:hypothetical protein
MEHLERYRKTGRVVSLASDIETAPLEHLHSDSLADPDSSASMLPGSHKTKRILDKFLLAIEVLAVVGLVFIIYRASRCCGFEQRVRPILIPPTLTPTPLIVPVILPQVTLLPTLQWRPTQ